MESIDFGHNYFNNTVNNYYNSVVITTGGARIGIDFINCKLQIIYAIVLSMN